MQRIASVVVSIYVLNIFMLPPATAIAENLSAAEAPGVLRIVGLATGGASASDEYLLLEADGGAVNLGLFDVAYRSASGLTSRRLVDLASIANRELAAGERVLLANAAGIFSVHAAATWSDGIAATGGAVMLRSRSDSAAIFDALSWGGALPAAGGEGAPAVAPNTDTALERRRVLGVLVDTHNNATDFVLVPVPSNPLSLAPVATPTAAPTSSPTATPAPTAPPTESPTPSTSPSSIPAAPSSLPTVAPTPTPVPQSPQSVASARSASIGAKLFVEGVVIAVPGELAEVRLAAISTPDGSAGIFLLVAQGEMPLQRGELVRASATLALRRQALTLLASSLLERRGNATTPAATSGAKPTAGVWSWERWEGRRVRLSGRLVGTPATLAGGALSLRIRLAEGGDLLLAAAESIASTLPTALRASGRSIVATGVMHQRGGSAGGGYRLWIDPLTGIVPSTPVSGGGGGSTGGGVNRPAGRVTQPVPKLQLPLGVPSVAIPITAGRGWLRAALTALGASKQGLSLRGELRIRLVTITAHDSCSATHGRALTVRGGLPILKRGDGSWGSSGLPGSTRSACGRSMKAPRGGGVARSLL